MSFLVFDGLLSRELLHHNPGHSNVLHPERSNRPEQVDAAVGRQTPKNARVQDDQRAAPVNLFT
ncbi:hypothetical protein [Streptomyces sp. NPDC002685]|uniref:hypothetical protein n=1 Tax=Streptomyces sp. NPDC002685 TaxID=3154540 RepID=UPI00331CF9D8